MGSSIRVWFLGVLAFCAVFLLCLQRQWGLIAPRPVAAAPAARAGPAQVSVTRTSEGVLLSGLVRPGERAPVLAEVRRVAGERTPILDRLIEAPDVGPIAERLGPLVATFFPSGRELHVGAGHVQLVAEVPDAAAKESLERRVDASSAGMSVQKKVTVAARPEPLQQQLDTLLTGTVIEFQTGSAELRPQSLHVVGALASTLEKQPQARVRIEGHTDASGRPEENQALSERRAESVKAALVARGVEATRIETLGFGSSRPLVRERTPEDRARNRRIQLTVWR
jgi:outer membrane protein OmpA-like peptidoglycan-associated protein